MGCWHDVAPKIGSLERTCASFQRPERQKKFRLWSRISRPQAHQAAGCGTSLALVAQRQVWPNGNGKVAGQQAKGLGCWAGTCKGWPDALLAAGSSP